MAPSEPHQELSWRQIAACVLLVVGLATIALSFVWSRVSPNVGSWTQEQALKYQAASANLHSLSHKYAHAAAEGKERAVQTELEKAQSEYGVLRAELDSARDRPQRIATILRVTGLVLAAIGAAGFYFRS